LRTDNPECRRHEDGAKNKRTSAHAYCLSRGAATSVEVFFFASRSAFSRA
jgi:hypothetical protein